MTIICGGGDELTTLLQHGRAQVSRNLFVCRAAGLIDTRSDVREVRKLSFCNTARDSPAAFGLPRFLRTQVALPILARILPKICQKIRFGNMCDFFFPPFVSYSMSGFFPLSHLTLSFFFFSLCVLLRCGQRHGNWRCNHFTFLYYGQNDQYKVR